MKKSVWVILIILLIATISFAEENELADEIIVETSVKINDSYLYSDTSHVLVNDTEFVVGSYLVKSLGGEIAWISESRTVKLILNEKVIELVIGSKIALIDGEEFELYKAPYIKDGRTMIPLKFVSENFGCDVSWEQETFTVNILIDDFEVPKEYTFERSYTDEDLYLLAKIVTVESGEMSLEVAMAIANTVLNRVDDQRFPNTIEEVIYQVDVYKQFPPAHKDSFKLLEPKSISIMASKRALEGINNIGASLFFNNKPFKSKSEDLIRIIDGEYFYY